MLKQEYTSSIKAQLRSTWCSNHIRSPRKPNLFDEAVDLIIIDDSYEGYNLTDDADYSLSENQGNLCITVILG